MTSKRHRITRTGRTLTSLVRPICCIASQSKGPNCRRCHSGTSHVSTVTRVFPIFFFLVTTLIDFAAVTQVISRRHRRVKALGNLNCDSFSVTGGCLVCTTVTYVMKASLNLITKCGVFPTIVFSTCKSVCDLPSMGVACCLSCTLVSVTVTLLYAVKPTT